jgi:O-succinylbenzoate synthase
VNALLSAEEKGLGNRAQALQAEGYQAVKLKVGRTSVEEDVRRVQLVDAALGEDVQLRLDANRAWTGPDARSFARQIDNVSVAYVEEPLANPEGIPRFIADTGLPVALDETTRESAPADLKKWGGVAAVVLKPTLLGGRTQVRKWVESARVVGAAPVFSAAYESGVGLRMLVALASVYSIAPAGFSTYDRLGADVLTPRLSLPAPEIDVDRVYDGTVDLAHLEEIASYD